MNSTGVLPLVSIIIPNFNSIEYIKQFTASLFATEYPNFEVIIVDDGSTDGTLKFLTDLARTEHRLNVITTLQKRGLTRSRNIAIECSKGVYVSFVETDMLFEPSWLSEAIAVLEKDQSIGGIHGKVLDVNNPSIIQAIGLKLIPQTGWVALVGFGEKDAEFPAKSEEVTMGAVGTVIRRSVLEKLHGFDEEMDRIDDIDLGWRVWVSGSRVVSVPSSVSYHVTVKNWSVRKKSVTKIQQEMAIGRMVRMMIKNYEMKNLVKYLPQAIFILIVRAFLNLARGNVNSFFGLFATGYWVLNTMPSALRERKYLQSIRGASDDAIFRSIMVKESLLNVYKKYHLEAMQKLVRFSKTV
jgi:GT2 family glycosyltransferase